MVGPLLLKKRGGHNAISLHSLYKTNTSGGVLPNIHSVLLPKKSKKDA